jgi:hypothetical protein
VYARSGRWVPVAVVMHAGLNVATAALPGGGPDHDPAPVATVTVLVAGLLLAHHTRRTRVGVAPPAERSGR